MNSLDLFKEMMNNEIEQKDRINNRITVPLGIVILLAGGAFSILEKINNLNHGLWFTIFLIGFILFSILTIITSVFLFKAFIGHKYRYFPYASQIKTIYDYWQNYYDQYYELLQEKHGISKQENIEKSAAEGLQEVLIESIDNNMLSNEIKTRYLQVASYYLVASVICGLFTIVPYFMCSDNSITNKIEVSNWPNYTIKGGVIMTEQNDGNQNATPTNPPPTNTSPPAPNPPKLTPRIINENFNLKVNKPATKVNTEQRTENNTKE